MTTIDLRQVPADALVIRFGGRPKSVNAYTFANSLISISEALREINGQVNAYHSIEIAVDAIGPGSFEAKIKTIKKRLPGLFKSTFTNVVIPILIWWVTDRHFSNKDVTVIANDDHYIVQRGGDRIILPKDVYDHAKEIKKPEQIQRNISKTFEALEDDPSVTELSFSARLGDEKPIVSFPRKEFPKLAIEPAILPDTDTRKTKFERVDLVIVRAILKKSRRKWQFVYQGFEISAAITHEEFFIKMANHEFEFGQGDILDARLKITQVKDEETDVFLNDPNGYEVVEVYDVIKGSKQGILFKE